MYIFSSKTDRKKILVNVMSNTLANVKFILHLLFFLYFFRKCTASIYCNIFHQMLDVQITKRLRKFIMRFHYHINSFKPLQTLIPHYCFLKIATICLPLYTRIFSVRC